jgi:hypothetical protein
MKKKVLYIITALISIIFLVGCSTSRPYATGGGLYRVTSTGAGISAESVTENVYEAAKEYAKEKGMVMYPESFNVRDGAYGRNPPSAELSFRLVKPNSNEASKAPKFISGLQKVEIINKSEDKSTNIIPANNLSIEDKLQKIKSIYDSGLITKDEYSEKRKNIINSY